ncbi:MAG: molybdopterin-guanine dinucleotide biosynthesis protein B [Thermodesulfobacteriota bacterium]
MGNASSVRVPIISIVGLSGSGKTTLMEKLIRIFSSEGLRVGTIKHSYHPHPLDAPGKDSWRHKNAGAEKVIFVGPKSFQLVSDIRDDETPEGLSSEYLKGMDIVLVEGFNRAGVEKIEVIRKGRSEKIEMKSSDNLIAVVTDFPEDALRRAIGVSVPILDIDDEASVVEFIRNHLSIPSSDIKKTGKI